MINVRNIHEQYVSVDEKNLVARRASYGLVVYKSNLMVLDTRSVNGKYWLIGGYKEGEETPEQTIKREALEESGHEVRVDKLIYQHKYNFAHPDGNFYLCQANYYTATSEGQNFLPHETTPLAWIPLIEVSPLGFHVLIQDAVKTFLATL